MEPTGFARKHRVQIIMEKLGQCDGIIKTCISICPDSRLTKSLEKLQEDIVDVAAETEMLSNGDEPIQASCKSIKSGRVSGMPRYNSEGKVWSDSSEEYVWERIKHKNGDTYHWDDTNELYWNDNGDESDYLMITTDEGLPRNCTPIKNSRKSIKSDYHDKEIYRQAFGALLEDYPPSEDIPGGYRVLVDGNYETEFSANSREEAIQKFKDYFAESRGINNSRKPIKSSLEDRLVPYLEEFEEGYANAITRDSEDASEFNHVYEDTFFEQFKSDYNLTDTDIQKLDRAVREIWNASSTEEGEVHDMGEMYGAPRGATPEEALKHFE